MDDLEAVRRRPGMYVGDVDNGNGLAHLVWEIVANSIDEHLAGRCTRIDVEIGVDGSVRVTDNGQGIRVDDVDGIPFAQRALTTLHRTPTMDGHAPHEHVALNGVGMFIVNAYSTWLLLEVCRDGGRYTQRFERGLAVSSLDRVGDVEETGTQVCFFPDPEIFPHAELDPGPLLSRLHELSFLLPGLSLRFRDLREHVFEEPAGLLSYVESKARRGAQYTTRPFSLEAAVDGVLIEAAATWSHRWDSSVKSFANIQRTTDGGTHIRGLLLGIVGAVKSSLPEACAGKTGRQIELAIAQGLVAVVCVRLNDPEFGAPTRDKLTTPRVRSIVKKALVSPLAQFISRNPKLADHIVSLLCPALGSQS